MRELWGIGARRSRANTTRHGVILMKNHDVARIDESLRSELTATLTDRRETLTRQLETLSQELPGVATDGEAQPNESQVSRLRHDQIAAALADTDRALAKLEHRDFGSCDECGMAIAADRLRALPDTTLCTTCATHP